MEFLKNTEFLKKSTFCKIRNLKKYCHLLDDERRQELKNRKSRHCTLECINKYHRLLQT